MSTLHQGGRGEGRCLNLTSYCVSVLRVLTRVVENISLLLVVGVVKIFYIFFRYFKELKVNLTFCTLTMERVCIPFSFVVLSGRRLG